MTTSSPEATSTRLRRWRLPAPPLRRRVLTAIAGGVAAVTALALALRAVLGTSATQPLAAIVFFTAVAGLAAGGMHEHHPFTAFGPANGITLVRLVMVTATASVLFEPPSSGIAIVVIIATAVIAILDGVDGWLARRSRLSSAFGARFDMETDALYMLVLSLFVWRHGKAGAWVIAIGLMRYAFVGAGWLLPWMMRPLRATMRGKTMAIVQFIALAFAMLPQVERPLSEPIAAAALVGLTWSFAADVRFLWRTRYSPNAVSRMGTS